MDEQFDDELKKHIREVFDNFEDPSADEGWLQLRKKYPEEKANRRAIAWIWWAAAAVLFLFLGIGLWVFIKNDQPVKFTVKYTKHQQSENLAATKNQRDTIVKTASVHAKNIVKPNVNNIASTSSNTSKKSVTNKIKPTAITNPIISNNTTGGANQIAKTVNGRKKRVNQSSSQQLAATGGAKSKIKPNVDNIALTRSNTPKTSATIDKSITAAVINPKISNDTSGKKAYMAKTGDSIKKTINQSSAQQLATTNQANNPNAASVIVKPKQPAKSINDMFAEDHAVKAKTIDEKYKIVHLGIYAGTYFNYARGSNNQVNEGMGVTADIKITENLKLVTGITVGQNSLNFSTSVPTSTAQASFASPGIASPGIAAAPSEFSINSLVTEASVPAFKNYDASLVGLDIPLNLKYELNPQKNDIYFLAGLSSGTFINETYTYQYNYPALASPTLQQVQDETSRRSFNSFYFAKTLNLAFGVGYPLGKNRIVLEPFLKYPLDGLGSQNIRFGAGGLNLKFNFQSQKK